MTRLRVLLALPLASARPRVTTLPGAGVARHPSPHCTARRSLQEVLDGVESFERRNRGQPQPLDPGTLGGTQPLEERRGDAARDRVCAWLVVCKPPVRDQVTVEVAARVDRVLRLLQAGGEMPSFVQFCGGELADRLSPAHPTFGHQMTTADTEPLVPRPRARSLLGGPALGYALFRMCAEARGIDVSGISFLVEERSSESLRDGLASLTLALRRGSGPPFRRGASSPPREGASPPTTPLLVRIFSAEHHLQQLRDIDTLLPRLSLLRPVHALGSDVELVPVAVALSNDAGVSRRARLARLADQLQLLRVNRGGIERSGEFFNQECYQRLKQVRKLLRDDLQLMIDSQSMTSVSASDAAPAAPLELDAVEEALTHLSRVQKALHPLAEDPVRGRIAARELLDAEEAVVRAISALRRADPDAPLSPRELGRLLGATRGPRKPD